MKTLLGLVLILMSASVIAKKTDCHEWLQNVASGNLPELMALSTTSECISAQSSDGKSALYIATENDDGKMVAWLIHQGADVNQRASYDSINFTPFLMAGAKGKNDALKALLKGDVDFERVNYYGGTALIPAAEKGHLETVAILLNDGRTNIDHVNNLGWTALLEVAILGRDTPTYQKVVQLLLEHGADAGIADRDGMTAIQHARKRGLTKITSILSRHLY